MKTKPSTATLTTPAAAKPAKPATAADNAANGNPRSPGVSPKPFTCWRHDEPMLPPKEFSYAADDWATAATEICQRLSLVREDEDERSLSYLDTFDWRIYRAGLMLARIDELLELSDRATGALVMRADASSASASDGALPKRLADRLSGVLGVRALTAVAAVNSHTVVFGARNDDTKTVARLVLSNSTVDQGEKQTALRFRLSIAPLRGYDRDATRLSEELAAVSGVEPMASSLFEEAVDATGRTPGDYSSKLSLSLSREVPAYDAARLIYRTLLDAMQANLDGILADHDTEFLHDFRVAVRRTRSALKELPGVLPVELEGHFRDEFSWLGGVTSPARDLDVYLLEFPALSELAGDAANDLGPLHRLIRSEMRRAHARVRTALRSARYRRLQEAWSHAIAATSPSAGEGPAGANPVGVLADSRIRKVARRVLRDGTRINDDSPAESLHDLRKRSKELRYLLEFFSSLYDPKPHGSVLVELKALQTTLGRFQDTQVQRHALEGFAERLLTAGDTPASVLVAIGRLVAVLEDQQQQARAEFTDRFAEFASARNRRRLAALTAGVT